MADRRHSLHEIVELLTDSARWPAGTVGTVVEADDAGALVEINDERGHGVDFVSLPHELLASTEERAPGAAT